jgi:hypothetical protein
MIDQKVALALMLAAVVMAGIATAIMSIFPRDGWSLLDPRISTIEIFRNARKYIRAPYARVMQITACAAWMAGRGGVGRRDCWQFLGGLGRAPKELATRDDIAAWIEPAQPASLRLWRTARSRADRIRGVGWAGPVLIPSGVTRACI